MATYKSVKDMIKTLSEDKSFEALALKEIEEKKLSKLLFVLRCKSGLSQKDMASKLNCSQSKISKIESSYDNDLSVKDLLDYGSILKLQLEIGYRKSSFRLVDQVKYHALKMKKCLDEMCDLAKDDPDLIEAVRKFYGEAFVNVIHMMMLSHEKLPPKVKHKQEEQRAIEISPPINTEPNCAV